MKKKGFLMPIILGVAMIGMVITIPSCGSSPTSQSQQTQVVIDHLVVEGAKTDYYAGETFSRDGITVIAVMSDGTQEEVTRWRVSNTKPLTENDTVIYITYDDATYELHLTITVKPVTGLELETQSMNLQVNEKKQIVATVSPSDASEKGLVYVSDTPTVATVDEKGLVTATGIGNAIITVTTKGKDANNNTISKTIAITVSPTAVTGLDIDVDDIILTVGQEKQIGVTILPTNATDKAVTFTSSNPSVASVGNTGLVKALAEGETKITVATHATGSNGNPFTQSFDVTVEGINTKYLVAFRNSDGTLLQGYKEGAIAVGETPEFNKRAPRKASDSEGVYIFRGFDKEIVPYEASTEEVTYTAVYQKRQYTITGVSLVLDGDKVVYSITGTSVANNPEVNMRSMYKGGNWTTSTLKQMGGLSYNPDGSWVMKADLLDSENAFFAENLNTTYIGKFKFGNGGDEDLKVLIRNDAKRYRHTADGEVVEIKDLADDWDGVTGYDGLSQEFKDAIPAPTWDGLNIDFKETVVEYNGLEYKLFANEDTWNCVSLMVQKAGSIDVTVTPKSVDLENINGQAYYVVSGSYVGNVTLDQLHKAYGIDFQAHSTLNGDGSWSYLDFDGSRKYSFDKTVSSIDTVNKTYVAKFLIDTTTYPQFVATVPYVFLVHTQLNGGQLDNMKITASDTVLTVGQYKFSLLKNSDTWTIACLHIEAAE